MRVLKKENASLAYPKEMKTVTWNNLNRIQICSQNHYRTIEITTLIKNLIHKHHILQTHLVGRTVPYKGMNINKWLYSSVTSVPFSSFNFSGKPKGKMLPIKRIDGKTPRPCSTSDSIVDLGTDTTSLPHYFIPFFILY